MQLYLTDTLQKDKPPNPNYPLRPLDAITSVSTEGLAVDYQSVLACKCKNSSRLTGIVIAVFLSLFSITVAVGACYLVRRKKKKRNNEEVEPWNTGFWYLYFGWKAWAFSGKWFSHIDRPVLKLFFDRVRWFIFCIKTCHTTSWT